MSKESLKTDFLIAFRYFKTRRKVGMASATSLITLVGVAVGTMAILVSLSVLNGFKDVITQRTRDMEPDLKIHVRSLTADEQKDILENLVYQFPEDTYMPVMERKVIASGTKQRLIQLKGVQPLTFDSMMGMSAYLAYQDFLTDDITQTDFPEIILGSGLAYDLGVTVGDTVTLISPIDIESFSAPVLKAIVKNTFDVDVFNYDDMLGFIHLLDMQYFLDDPGWHEIYVRSEDPDARDKISALLPDDIPCIPWQEEHRELFAAMEMEKKGTFLVLNLIILLAGFNLVSSLVMLLLEKKWEIGILKSMGLRDRDAFRIYFILSWITGGIGMLIGLLGSVPLLLWQQVRPFVKLPQDVYFITYLPVRVMLPDVVLTVLVLIAIISLAGLLPARQAVKLKPLDSIKVKM
ncbi:ABC transporter permease [Fidelibacter multiformis]|uniref:ABC transporter permease n=1 Tax=Fidelibacter multiformis TaxID=3377529 RepID=UPI0037DC81B5